MMSEQFCERLESNSLRSPSLSHGVGCKGIFDSRAQACNNFATYQCEGGLDGEAQEKPFLSPGQRLESEQPTYHYKVLVTAGAKSDSR